MIDAVMKQFLIGNCNVDPKKNRASMGIERMKYIQDVIHYLKTIDTCLAKGVRCYKAELFYNVVKSKRRHWFVVTLSFTRSNNKPMPRFLLHHILK